MNIDSSELFDLNLIVQIFNFENGKTLVGENLFSTIEIFENPTSIMPIVLKLKNSEGEEGAFGEATLYVAWVPEGSTAPIFS